MTDNALAVSYAALILVDAKLPVTEENLTKLVAKVCHFSRLLLESQV
jgi:hypothetical protein